MVSMLHNSFMVGLRLAGAVLCLAVTVSFGVGCVHAADVQWQADQNKLTADLRRLQLGDALKAVGRSMGWTVWIELDSDAGWPNFQVFIDLIKMHLCETKIIGF